MFKKNKTYVSVIFIKMSNDGSILGDYFHEYINSTSPGPEVIKIFHAAIS